jgi:hypothetical protein
MLEERRRKVFDSYKTHAQHIKDVAEGLIEAYRTANLERRSDRDHSSPTTAYPASYLQEVKIQIPKPLQGADPPALGPAVAGGSAVGISPADSCTPAASREGGEG